MPKLMLFYFESYIMNEKLKKFNSLKKIKEMILNKRPVLKQVLSDEGSQCLFEYSNKYTNQNKNQLDNARQKEFIETMLDVVKKRFGTKMSDSVSKQLQKYYFVSTADHTGPINSSYFLNSNLIISESIINKKDPILENNIVLSCAKVSIENISFPRGLYFHNYTNGALKSHRIPFFSSHIKPGLVYCVPPYKTENLEQIYSILNSKLAKKEISDSQHQKVTDLVKEVYDQPEILKSDDYCEQISKTNLILWQKIMSKSNVKLPNLIYLELEDIVSKLIIKNHLYQNTLINKIFFNEKYDKFIDKYFENNLRPSINTNGTYLFLALPAGAKYCLQLTKEGKFLKSKNGEYSIEMTPENLKMALEKKELIPNLLLSFVIIACYYGVKCLGGFNQINYLTEIKEKYIDLNNDIKNFEDNSICANVDTKIICDGLSIAYLGYNSNETTLASGLDLILYNNENSWQTLDEMSKNISLDEAINPLLPEIYKISYDQKEWEDDLIELTETDISEMTGLNKKIRPCASIV